MATDTADPAFAAPTSPENERFDELAAAVALTIEDPPEIRFGAIQDLQQAAAQ